MIIGPWDDAFALSPTGLEDSRATVDIAIRPTDNNIRLDGAVIIYFNTVGISLNIELSPNRLIMFNAKIAFADALEFDLVVTTIGSFDGTSSKDLDFTCEVEMHQEIFQHIINEAQRHFQAMFGSAKASNVDKENVLDVLEAALTENYRALRIGLTKQRLLRIKSLPMSSKLLKVGEDYRVGEKLQRG